MNMNSIYSYFPVVAVVLARGLHHHCSDCIWFGVGAVNYIKGNVTIASTADCQR